MIIFGIFLYAFGFSAFIFPEKIVIGGLAGVGTLIYFVTEKLFGYGVPVEVSMYALNITLLAMAFKTVGKQFILRTIFGATLISLFIGWLTPLFPAPLVAGQTFMNVLVGGIMCGIGIGLVFIHNGSTGGTDIVAAMMAKTTNVSVGRTMLYCDMTTISLSFLLFGKVDNVVYGFIDLVLISFLTDMVINTNRQAVQFIIFSNKWEEIAAAINNKANRGCTVLNGMGWYTKHEVKILLVMCRKIESVTVFRIIKSIDENAFITQANVNGVYGQGFDKIKVKVRPEDRMTPNEAGTEAKATDKAPAQALPNS